MCQSGAEMIPFEGNEHLSLVFEAPERSGMEQAVSVPRECRAERVLFLLVGAVWPLGARALGSRDREPLFLRLLPERSRRDLHDRTATRTEDRSRRIRRVSPTR